MNAAGTAALPYFREQRHIGLGRRMLVDAFVGDFTSVTARAELFERDWRRAGRPVAGNLAIGAYAAAMVYGMLGDRDARERWVDITRALLSSPERFERDATLWRVTAQPDADERLRRAAASTYGNEIVATIIERAIALHEGRDELLGAIAERFTKAGCTYQARRTDTFLTRPRTRRPKTGPEGGSRYDG